MPRDLQFRLSGHDIDRGRKRAVRALIRNLDRKINRHAKRHAQNIQEREQPMPRGIAHHLPIKKAQVRCSHGKRQLWRSGEGAIVTKSANEDAPAPIFGLAVNYKR